MQNTIEEILYITSAIKKHTARIKQMDQIWNTVPPSINLLSKHLLIPDRLMESIMRSWLHSEDPSVIL